MASPSSLSSVTKEEFEELEVAEFDANVLWELLHDEPSKEEAGSGGGAPMQAMEAVSQNPATVAENYWCLNNVVINNNDDMVEDFDWFRIMEETSTTCNDMGGWYGETCMEEMNQNLEIGEYYSVSHSAILCDEIGYIGLWHDN